MKKKKKGRPSLLDLQKRAAKQQEIQQNCINSKLNPSPNRRSTRRNPNLDGLLPPEYNVDDVDVDDVDVDDERIERKHKLLHGLPRSSMNFFSSNLVLPPYGSDSNVDGGDDPEACKKKRRINAAVGDGSAQGGEKLPKATDTPQGSLVDSGPTTPLPDKKLLTFILDKLQKKDTHGVFSEPVDPEELPEYHDIIEHPMDFGTMREKLDKGLYTNLEQFEKDVFLISSNAMEYNAPDTIYFRQARSIQELAKKDFEILRQDSDDSEPQPKVVRKRGRPPSKNLKKFLGRSPLGRCDTKLSSNATLATGGSDNAVLSNSYNLRTGQTPYKFRPADALGRASHGSCNSETYTGWISKLENEFPASVLKGVIKYGKKEYAFDENRRDTYQHQLSSEYDLSHLGTLEGDMRQLIAVGLHSEHGYARSLARFAADLGTIVWKIASEKIGQVLPVGLNFGPGWVGEKEMLQQQHQSHSFSDKHGSVNNPVSHPSKPLHPSVNHPSKPLHPSTFDSNFVSFNGSFPPIKEDMVDAVSNLNSQSDSSFLSRSVGRVSCGPTFQIQQKPVIHSGLEEARIPSHLLGIGPSSHSTSISPMPWNHFKFDEPESSGISSRLQTRNSLTMTSCPDSRTTREAGFCWEQPWEGFLPQHKQEFLSVPTDLNLRFRSTSSPSSSFQIGSPQQQPDLALQL